PLHAEGKPILIFRFDAFHHAVQRVGTDQKAAGHLVDGGAVLAVDHNLALAIEIRQASAGHDGDRVSQASFRRMAMLESLGQLARQIDKSGAAKRAVEYLHASVDSQGRQMTVVAPMTEMFLLRRLPRSPAFTAADYDAVQLHHPVL